MYDIKIKGVTNGWIVEIGCKTFVSTDKKEMLKQIGRYIDEPEKVEKEFVANAVNQGSPPQ